ncbi:MAG: RecQ family zinc-binding domain-containing protein, partial [Bacteroidales bacterium]|nr:RecQ family zinc-binding domain-containing protein [Bacteroidales bacterium]
EEPLDEKNLLISPERSNLRKERSEKRIKEMIRYATSENLCRNQFLLGYFGQLKSPRCGRCDVCVEKKRIHPGSQDHQSIKAGIENILAEGSQDLETIVEALGQEPEMVISVVEHMLENGSLIRGKDLKISRK